MEFVNVQDVEVPALGLGTWQFTGDACRDGVEHALSIGYRHIDTAQAYGNEEQVGEALSNSRVSRDDVFLTTKIWRTNVDPDQVGVSLEESLQKLDTDYVDLLLIHWPDDEVPFADTLGAMESARAAGKVKNIGVSNFTISQFREAAETADILCNQVEYHPFLAQNELLEIADEFDLMLTAYSPLARGRVPDDETLNEIGNNHGKSAAQVGLRWLVQQDRVAAIPKAATAEHRESNFEIFDFELTDEEMERIHDLNRDERLLDPGFAPDWER